MEQYLLERKLDTTQMIHGKGKLLYVHIMGYQSALKIYILQRYWGTEIAQFNKWKTDIHTGKTLQGNTTKW